MESLYWCDGSGRINLTLTLAQAQSCSGSGRQDENVRALSAEPAIAAQLAEVDPAALRAALKEYGAWDASELADHAQNLQRLLWLACCDVAEDPEVYR